MMTINFQLKPNELCHFRIDIDDNKHDLFYSIHRLFQFSSKCLCHFWIEINDNIHFLFYVMHRPTQFSGHGVRDPI